MKNDRYTGILMHPVSFPSPYAIGDIGDASYRFIDVMNENKVSLWQVLPLGPTGYGDSPYASRSTFAGNELLIDLKRLYLDGYLELEDIMTEPVVTERVDYGRAKEIKMPLLRKAASVFLKTEKNNSRYKAFCNEHSYWLEDYALYQSLCDRYNDSRWFSIWPEDLRIRKKSALDKAKAELKDEMDIWCVLQYFFFSQWESLKEYANEKGVRIIGDIPIFVAPDSADAWTNTKLLKIDASGEQEASSGVPPDAFSSTGQLWGNPLYRWEEHEKENFSWWIRRVSAALRMCDIVRIDHFRGFEACWEVPKGEKTAMNGKWVKSPGEKLLRALTEKLGDDLPIIAEDLGVITPEVEALRDTFCLPGMKILQFAFSVNDSGELESGNAYLPHNIERNSVAYTGTHDNNTTCGWYKEQSDAVRDAVRRYFECPDDQVPWQMIRHLLMSNAKYAVIPMQDLLMLDENSRMNVPSTCGSSNWSWKMPEWGYCAEGWSRLHYYNKLYGRVAEK